MASKPLAQEKVDRILELRRQGMGFISIARAVGVGTGTVVRYTTIHGATCVEATKVKEVANKKDEIPKNERTLEILKKEQYQPWNLIDTARQALVNANDKMKGVLEVLDEGSKKYKELADYWWAQYNETPLGDINIKERYQRHFFYAFKEYRTMEEKKQDCVEKFIRTSGIAKSVFAGALVLGESSVERPEEASVDTNMLKLLNEWNTIEKEKVKANCNTRTV
jgi:hypothetical protein